MPLVKSKVLLMFLPSFLYGVAPGNSALVQPDKIDLNLGREPLVSDSGFLTCKIKWHSNVHLHILFSAFY